MKQEPQDKDIRIITTEEEFRNEYINIMTNDEIQFFRGQSNVNPKNGLFERWELSSSLGREITLNTSAKVLIYWIEGKKIL